MSKEDGCLFDTVVNFKWMIKDFCLCKNMKTKLKSPVYKGDWQLELYPNGDPEATKGYVLLYLTNKRNVEIETTATLSLLNDESKINYQRKYDHKFAAQQGFGFASFVKHSFIRDSTNQVLIDGTLIVQCEIFEKNDQNKAMKEKENNIEETDDKEEETVEEKEETDEDKEETDEEDEETDKEEKDKKESNCLDSRKEKDQKQIEMPDITFRLKEFDTYEYLLENPKHSDIIFIVSSIEVPAHKTILMARSTIFENILTSDKSESCKTKMEINDMTPAIFKELLRFIYAGKVSDIDKYAKPLLIAAEKYSIEGLKIKCDEVLSNSLSTQNALDYLNLADTYNSPNLKSKAIKFVSSHLSDIIIMPEFNMIKELNKDVIAELFSETGHTMQILRKSAK